MLKSFAITLAAIVLGAAVTFAFSVTGIPVF